MKALFVTGTGTGVGKTLVGGALCAYLSLKRGIDVGVMKPIETGWNPSNSDGLTLKELSGSNDSIDEIVPYRFYQPLAPEVAAQKENVEVSIEKLDLIYRKLLNSHDFLVIEGAGGILVPLKEGFFFSDLVKMWNTPVLVVSENRLGTINCTLLTCHFLFSQGIQVIGVILNEKEKRPDDSCDSNPTILKKYLPVPVLGIFPNVEKPVLSPSLRKNLSDLFEENIKLPPFLP